MDFYTPYGNYDDTDENYYGADENWGEEEATINIDSDPKFVWSTLDIYSINKVIKIKENIAKTLSKLDANGQTLLHSMASRDISYIRPDVMKKLVKLYNNRTDLEDLVNIQNRAEETALHIAVLNRNAPFVKKMLTVKKINAGIRCHRNLTPLDMAAWMQDSKTRELLANHPTSTMTVEAPNQRLGTSASAAAPIYQWGQMFTTELTMVSVPQPTTVLFNHTEHSVSNIQFGGNFALMLTDTGMVYSWGLCSYGKLGHDIKNDCPIPSQIFEFKNKQITSIACGKDHSLALDEIGCVYAWGNGAGGRLGLDASAIVQLPTIIPYFPDQVKIVAISCGQDHSMALCSSGKVFSWGQANMGKLGYKTALGFQSTPKEVPSLPPCSQISCGSWHSLVLTKKGEVYAFGSDMDGRCGRKYNKANENIQHVPTKIVAFTQKIRKIGAGLNFNAVLSEGNMVWTWGNNDHGQLGVLIKTSSRAVGVDHMTHEPQLVKQLLPYPINNIEVGNEHVVVLSDTGEVYTFGGNQHSQCGQGKQLCDTGNFYHIEIPNNSTVFKIAAGSHSSLVSLSTGHNIFGAEMVSLLADETYSDVRIIASGNQTDYINAHRIILATRCAKIDQLLTLESLKPNSKNSVPLTQTTSIQSSTSSDGIVYINFESITSLEPLRLLVKFLYTDHAKMVPTYIRELGELASSLDIERLSYLCNITQIKSLDTIPTSRLVDDFARMDDPAFVERYHDIQFKLHNQNLTASCDKPIELVCSYKAILSLRSDYFKMMLQGQFAEKDKREIDMYEIDPTSFKNFLRYLYCNQVPEDPTQCLDLIVLADLHQIVRAKELCAGVIRPSIDPSNICFIYKLAIEFNVKPLIIWCKIKLPTLPNPKKLPFFDQLPTCLQLELETTMTAELTQKFKKSLLGI